MIEITLRSLLAAGLALLIVAPLGGALGLLLARRRIPLRPVVDTLITLPMVLPPVAVGVLIIWCVSPRYSALGRLLDQLDIPFLLTFRGVVLCAVVMGLPLMAKAAETAFAAIAPEHEDAATNLGASRTRTLRSITLPLAWRGLVAGALLAFARALGEFGATVLVAGYRPGRTDTLALGIYFAYENPARRSHMFGLILIAIALCFLAALGARLAVGDRPRLSRLRPRTPAASERRSGPPPD